jgi:hypothetical protein
MRRRNGAVWTQIFLQEDQKERSESLRRHVESALALLHAVP